MQQVSSAQPLHPTPLTNAQGWIEPTPTALLVLADGTVLSGQAIGADTTATGEVCFNTAMTGYEEILTDPSYAGQIITFTFPHIGNVGTNEEDIETVDLLQSDGARGVVVHTDVTSPSNWRAASHFDAWLKARGIPGIAGVDTRALTAHIRDHGMANAVLATNAEGLFDVEALKAKAAQLPSMDGLDLVPSVGVKKDTAWTEASWSLEGGYRALGNGKYHVIALDFGVKRNILRLLTDRDCRVTVVPATASFDEMMALKPDGVFLSNGPGDPAATGEYSVPVIKALIENDIPTFGICLGHQMLALAVGARTMKMKQGHHGANHPVKDFTTQKVEIVSMNHGFAVDRESLPIHAVETHISLFDGSNCGIALTNHPAFSVQHHPEASPGPRDSHYLFDRFIELMEKHRKAA
jgi:carbamoyl-phosphate synthase small subunit